MARRFGLRWLVTTDHGGPNHAKLNLVDAYRELQQSRRLVPDVLQFYGMELNMPGMDHHTLIIPRAAFEASALFDIESRFDANEATPPDPTRNGAQARVAALTYMASLPALPLMFANHPSRSAKALGAFGDTEPWEIRQSHDAAPDVYRGMEGAPGHQAGGLHRDGSLSGATTRETSPARVAATAIAECTHARWLRSDDRCRRWLLGFTARRRPAVLDRGVVGFARALQRADATRQRFLAGRVPQDVRLCARTATTMSSKQLRAGRICLRSPAI